MRRQLRAAFLALLGFAGCSLILAQAPPIPNVGPRNFSLNGSSGTFIINGLSSISFCTVSVDSTSTMGSGTVTMKTSNDNGASYYGVTGVPDLGSGSSPSQTITIAGTQLTAPVAGKTNFEIVLSGATGAAITGNILCNSGTGTLAGSSGGSSTVTCASPGCVITGTVSNNCVSNCTPAPTTTVSPGGYVGVTDACPSSEPGQVNSAYSCTINSSGQLIVTTPAPQVTAAGATFPGGAVAHDLIGIAGVLTPALPIGCNQSATFSTTGPGTAELIALTSGDSIYVCGYEMHTTAGSGSILKSANNACTSSVVALATTLGGQPAIVQSPFWTGLGGPQPLLGDALCVQLGTSGTAGQFTVFYTIASPGP